MRGTSGRPNGAVRPCVLSPGGDFEAPAGHDKDLGVLKRRHRLRRVERIPLDIPAVMMGGRFMRVIVRDLSVKGLFFQCPHPPGPGTIVTIRFSLPNAAVTIDMVGDVRFQRPHGAGIRALRLNTKAREAIVRFTEHVRRPIGPSL